MQVKLVWGKFLNAGQTCVAPDYLCVHKSVAEKLLKLIVDEIHKQFGSNIRLSKDYPRVVNKSSLERLMSYLMDGKIYFGGNIDKDDLYMEPTIITKPDLKSPLMTDEIFGPILPVLVYEDLSKVVEFINNREKPLALYYFSENKKKIKYILRATTSGGVTINDTIIHVANSNLPFGGVGNSGVGKYHGRESFEAFTHNRAVMDRGTFAEFNVRFAPYKNKLKLVKKIMK